MTELAPCPFCASSAVRIIGKQHARAIACENCYVEASPGWRQQTDANFAAFWTRCRHPGAYTLAHILCPRAASNHGRRQVNPPRVCGKISRITAPPCFQISTFNGRILE
jgi:hypothetical protein